MTRRPWYVRWLRALDRFSAWVQEDEYDAMPSYAERKQRATLTRTDR